MKKFIYALLLLILFASNAMAEGNKENTKPANLSKAITEQTKIIQDMTKPEKKDQSLDAFFKETVDLLDKNDENS